MRLTALLLAACGLAMASADLLVPSTTTAAEDGDDGETVHSSGGRRAALSRGIGQLAAEPVELVQASIAAEESKESDGRGMGVVEALSLAGATAGTLALARRVEP
mmetsp:Transcript_63990/g.164704  ORF Transcript_63990/g.164704 Transcript_63990/m.164704 type:complete len:105 (-) Transcript_63990:102-416(-)